MKQIKFWFQFITKLFKRYWYIILISLVSSGAFFFLFAYFSSFISKQISNTNRIGLVGRYRVNNLPEKVSKLFSYGLTETLPNGRATSSPIVSNWTISGDGKEYNFFLKEGVKWQDGETLKSNQINYLIEGTKFISNPGEVVIKLDSAYAPLPTLLTQPLIKKRKIGLGEYKIKQIKTQGGVISTMTLVSSQPETKKLHFSFYSSQEDLITAFQLGKIDEAWGVTELDPIKSWENLEIKTEQYEINNYSALFLNTRKPPLDNKRVRQALAYCLQKPSKKDRAIGPIAPTSWAYNPSIKRYDYDPKHGQELFEEGWDPTEKISLTITTLPELLDTAEKVRNDWQSNLNISITIKVSRFVPDTENFDIFLGYGIIPTDPDQYTFWHSTQAENLTGINNPKIDQLLEKGRKTLDIEERKEIYSDFQQTLSEEVPAIFLSYPKHYTIVRK